MEWLNQEQQAAWRAFIMGHQLLLDRLDRDLRESHGISLNEYEVLVRLSEAPGQSMRMATLADAMCHSRSRLTHTVGRMENATLVVRTATADDGRGILATMTARGREVLVEAAPTHVQGVRENLIDLATDSDVRALGRIFDAVSDRLMEGRPAIADVRH